jgi:hypothetical protein
MLLHLTTARYEVSHGGEDPSQSLLACDAMYYCSRIQMFWMSLLPPCHPGDGGSKVL